jgi:hypothetical protein
VDQQKTPDPAYREDMGLDNAGQRAATGSKAPQSKAFVTAGKPALISMSVDRGVCAANPLSWLY